MKAMSIGFIGGGRITRILLEGWKRKGVMPKQVVVSDCNAETLGKLGERFQGIEVAPGDSGLAASQDVVVLAVHPPVMGEVAQRIKSQLKADAIVISLAPKVTVEKLAGMLGGFGRVARVIPNGPSVMGAGFNPVFFGPALGDADKAVVCALLSPLGEHPEVEEAKLEGYALLSAMGPTYLWFQLQALREVAQGFGLDEAEVSTAMKRMVCGATRTLLESGLSPAEVMDLVPVKPLAEMEGSVTEMYRTRLPALFQKIKP